MCPTPPHPTLPPPDLNTPMAPELGLFLDECYYSAYNKQWGDLHCALQQADFQQQVDEFKVSGLPRLPRLLLT